jgi:replication initiation protein RepC
MEEGIAPNELLRFAPELQTHLRGRHPTWSNIIDAADALRDDLGISKSLWDEACVTMNRYRAAVAIAIVSTKEPGHLRSPGGYFRGMVAKDRAQELHLDRTIWAWRRASQPQHQRGRGGGLDQSAG